MGEIAASERAGDGVGLASRHVLFIQADVVMAR
jgi:hypothetical protein